MFNERKKGLYIGLIVWVANYAILKFNGHSGKQVQCTEKKT